MFRLISVAILIFNGISACFGGIVLIIDPTGSIIQLPLNLLDHSPFTNFLIPGIILLIVIGIGSLLTGASVLIRAKNYPLYIIAEGNALVIWIVTQIIMIQSLSLLQFIYGGIGLLFILLGFIQWEVKKWVEV